VRSRKRCGEKGREGLLDPLASVGWKYSCQRGGEGIGVTHIVPSVYRREERGNREEKKVNRVRTCVRETGWSGEGWLVLFCTGEVWQKRLRSRRKVKGGNLAARNLERETLGDVHRHLLWGLAHWH